MGRRIIVISGSFVMFSAIFFVGIMYYNSFPCDSVFAKKFKIQFLNKIEKLEIKADDLLKKSQHLNNHTDLHYTKKSFHELKNEYTKIEFLVGYLYPHDGELIKGLEIQEPGEVCIKEITNEEGLCIIENILYGERALELKQELINKVRNLRTTIIRLKYFMNIIFIPDNSILEAIELQEISDRNFPIVSSSKYSDNINLTYSSEESACE